MKDLEKKIKKMDSLKAFGRKILAGRREKQKNSGGGIIMLK